jgi:hypothetical protein
MTVPHSAWFKFGVEPAGTREAFPACRDTPRLWLHVTALPLQIHRGIAPCEAGPPAPGTGASTASMWPLSGQHLPSS